MILEYLSYYSASSTLNFYRFHLSIINYACKSNIKQLSSICIHGDKLQYCSKPMDLTVDIILLCISPYTRQPITDTTFTCDAMVMLSSKHNYSLNSKCIVRSFSVSVVVFGSVNKLQPRCFLC